MGRQFYVYILASRKHGTLYIGITNDLIRRVHEHKLKLVRLRQVWHKQTGLF
jgi:putative endonuclease